MVDPHLNEPVIPVRECTCTTPRPTYCPILVTSSSSTDVFNACALSRDNGGVTSTLCFISPRFDLYLFSRSIWPLIIFLICALVLMLAVTQTGQRVRKCITRQCLGYFCCWKRRGNNSTSQWFQRCFGSNESEVDRIVEQEIQIRHQMLESSYIAGIRMWLRIHGIQDEQHVASFLGQYIRGGGIVSSLEEQSHMAYVLKTRKYVSPTKKQKDDEDTEVDVLQQEGGDSFTQDQEENESSLCTICYTLIEDGQKVGAISCNHNFHVECLSMWIQRRNGTFVFTKINGLL